MKAPECMQESALIYVSEDAALNKKGSVPFLHFTPAVYDNLGLVSECLECEGKH